MSLDVTILIDLIIFVSRTYALIIAFFCSIILTGEVDEELICPICSQVLEEPVQVICY
jgi:hypothetical protein